MSYPDLEGKVAIVTGSGRGIGRGIALRYGREKMKVVVASRTQSTVDSVVKEIKGFGGAVLGVTCDVGYQDQIQAMVAKTLEAFGTVDVLVNNAQGFGVEAEPARTPVLTPLEDYGNDQWEYTFRTGASATLWTMQAVFPAMKENGGGSIINFGSRWGLWGMEGAAAYNATKEAIRALSRTAAREWGKYNITVNVINPTLMTEATDAFYKDKPDLVEKKLQDTPLRRFGDPEQDGGGVAAFLASRDSSFLTGMTFAVDGGKAMFAL